MQALFSVAFLSVILLTMYQSITLTSHVKCSKTRNKGVEIRTTCLVQLYRSNDSEIILLVMTAALGELKNK